MARSFTVENGKNDGKVGNTGGVFAFNWNTLPDQNIDAEQAIEAFLNDGNIPGLNDKNGILRYSQTITVWFDEAGP